MYNVPWNRHAGKKPDRKLLVEASTYAIPGSKTHLVVAMAMRPNGLTQDEVISLLGHPYRNKIRQLVKEHKVQMHVLPEGTRRTRIRLVKG